MSLTSRIVTNDLKPILKGLYKAADIVISTMGGAGKNVILSNNMDEIIFTKDGVSVAKHIRFDNPEENVGAQLLINAAKKTVYEHGDGTTLTSLFIKEFAKQISQKIEDNPDTDINALLDEVKAEIELVKEELRKVAKKIDSNHDIYSVAYTSSKSSRLAAFIAEIYSKTGLKANISVEKSRISSSSYYELTKGLSFEGGFIHPSFGDKSTGTCYFEKPFIFITQDNVVVPSDYDEIIETNYQNNVPVVFIAPNFSDAFIRYCLTNMQRGGLQICLVRTPGWGAAANENLKDIKAFINSDGTCSSIKITAMEMTIYNDPEPVKIKKRTEQLQSLADNAVEGYDEDAYLARISALNQSSAIIYVGGITDKNIKEEYDRLEDAVGAVKSAIRDGYVRGAGLELYNLINNIDGYFHQETILTCQRPFIQILENARLDYRQFKTDKPYNIRNKVYDDNLIDPVGMICSSLDNSFALVELLINTSYLVYNE